MQWYSDFLKALSSYDYEKCEMLLKARPEISTPNNFQKASIYVAIGDYYTQVSNYQEAIQEYSSAIAVYDEEIALEPTNLSTLENKLLTLSRLADLQKRANQTVEALANCQETVAICNQIIAKVLSDKANAIHLIADIQNRLGQQNNTLTSYQSALETYDQALGLAVENASSQNSLLPGTDTRVNQAAVFSKIADFHSEDNPTEALKNYQASIAIYDEILKSNSRNVNALSNQATAIRNLGNVQYDLGSIQDAISSYQQSIALYDEVLKFNPQSINTIQNKIMALLVLGDTLAEVSQPQMALKYWQVAKQSLAHAFEIAPNYERLYQLDQWLQERL